MRFSGIYNVCPLNFTPTPQKKEALCNIGQFMSLQRGVGGILMFNCHPLIKPYNWPFSSYNIDIFQIPHLTCFNINSLDLELSSSYKTTENHIFWLSS